MHLQLCECLCALPQCRERAGPTPLSRGCPFIHTELMDGGNAQDTGKPDTVGKLTQPHCPAAAQQRQLLWHPQTSVHGAPLPASPASLESWNQPQLGHSRLRAEGQALGITALQLTARPGGKGFPQRFVHSTQRNKISAYKSKVIWIKSDINQKWYELRQRE